MAITIISIIQCIIIQECCSVVKHIDLSDQKFLYTYRNVNKIICCSCKFLNVSIIYVHSRHSMCKHKFLLNNVCDRVSLMHNFMACTKNINHTKLYHHKPTAKLNYYLKSVKFVHLLEKM